MMEQVNAATEVPTAAPAPAAPPVGPTPAAATPAPVDGDMINVPRDSLPEWAQNSWHNVAEAAKKHRALGPMGDFAQELLQAGYAPAQVREVMIQAERAGSLAEPTPQPSLTRADLEAFGQTMTDRLQKQFGQTLTEQKATQDQLAQRQQTLHAAQQVEVEFRDKALKDMGFQAANEDGSDNVIGLLARREFNHALNTVLEAGKPEGLDEQALRDYYKMPTEDHLKAAAEQAAYLKDLKYEMTAEVALAQEQTPTASLGTGTAAVPAGPKYEDMTQEERRAAITQGVEIARPDDAPDSEPSE